MTAENGQGFTASWSCLRSWPVQHAYIHRAMLPIVLHCSAELACTVNPLQAGWHRQQGTTLNVLQQRRVLAKSKRCRRATQ